MKEYCKKTPSLPILINCLLQIRFENYCIFHYENLNPTNKDMDKLRHSLKKKVKNHLFKNKNIFRVHRVLYQQESKTS